jgi:DNA-dependent RNA polymerase auxiliary subunit epsilon
MTTVDLNNTGYKDDPFVLAAEVNQVFYMKDMSTKPKREKNDDKSTNEPKRHIVLIGKRNIVRIEDKSDMSEDYEKDERIPPFSVTIDLSILLNAKDTPWLRHDHNQGAYVKKFTIVPT